MMKTLEKYLVSGMLIGALGLGTTQLVRLLVSYSNRRLKSLTLDVSPLLRANPTNFSIGLIRGKDNKKRAVIRHKQFEDEAYLLKKKNNQIEFVPTTLTAQNLEGIINEEKRVHYIPEGDMKHFRNTMKVKKITLNLVPKGENIEKEYINPDRLRIDLVRPFSKDLDTAILYHRGKQYLVTFNEEEGIQVKAGRDFLYLKGYSGKDIFVVNPTNYRIKLADIDGSGKAAVILHHKDSDKIYGVMEDNKGVVRLKPLSTRLSETKQLPEIADLTEGYVDIKEDLGLLLNTSFFGESDSNKAILRYRFRRYPLRHKDRKCEIPN